MLYFKLNDLIQTNNLYFKLLIFQLRIHILPKTVIIPKIMKILRGNGGDAFQGTDTPPPTPL